MVLQAIQYEPASGSSPPALRILDQLLLPHRTTYVDVPNCEEAHAAIKTMKVRGAPAIAIVAALALAVELGAETAAGKLPSRADDVKETAGQRLDYLKTSRPTAVNLGDAVGKLKIVAKKAAIQSGATAESVAQAYIVAAERMLVDDVSDNKAIGEHGARWIEANTVAGKKRKQDRSQQLKVLTHCNTGSLATAGYGTALGVIRSLRAGDMLTQAYCTETRPYNQGSRLTAYELVHDEIPATLITDSMACALLAKEGTNLAAIVVGADRVAANGDTANKIGTYSLAVLARHHGVKFLVAAPRTTIDLATSSGQDIEIEQRAPEEVTRIKGPKVATDGKVLVDEGAELISTAAIGIDVWNPAFDVTPAELIDGVITERGVVEKVDGKFDFAWVFQQP
ncbi:S-methyl-5-thioribose-1-phosphate isomerase [Elasticomyces elasticus]|uniref:Methylthioribose-1-phosphate isomerase n=1 Tax=Exophiala sideris TaxID=1016849 RepID=A0ABR0J4D8_9EURO|nr:S-methyl-5-thioribose-1-phosphate isomerase [Elasticomyces elasticus]KAK5026909.1 S-methyl-5-thioribose-1-phosphate isomerase [Exophiala sideris]KAK5033913.1 S-methyl-5-thioribose-1-phosphate isomerase [Exophiala sideris]KAK5055812.1 S-methyl-5-thioribose-1-phosphate isomerase [Exophiala sideris]KAK5180855.1 S-methyl-5-thioribose-1-phosphate isomerase [Eurotiomycetes sp. CCFEE 6388]